MSNIIATGLFFAMSYVGYKVFKKYEEYKELDKSINKNPFIKNSNNLSKIEITHITENNDELKNLIEKSLNNIYYPDQENDENEENDENNEENIISPHDKILVEYNLNNNCYSLWVTGKIFEIIKNNSKNNGGLKRQIISAYLKSENNDETVDVSKLLKEFHGPNSDFNLNLNGVSHLWSDVLYPYNITNKDSSWYNSTLIINDLFGSTTTINTFEQDIIQWNSEL